MAEVFFPTTSPWICQFIQQHETLKGKCYCICPLPHTWNQRHQSDAVCIHLQHVLDKHWSLYQNPFDVSQPSKIVFFWIFTCQSFLIWMFHLKWIFNFLTDRMQFVDLIYSVIDTINQKWCPIRVRSLFTLFIIHGWIFCIFAHPSSGFRMIPSDWVS